MMPDMEAEALAAHAAEAERRCLSLAFESGGPAALSPHLKASHLFGESRAKLYRAACLLADAGQPHDAWECMDHCRREGHPLEPLQQEVAECLAFTLAPGSAASVAASVRRAYVARRTRTMAHALTNGAAGDPEAVRLALAALAALQDEAAGAMIEAPPAFRLATLTGTELAAMPTRKPESLLGDGLLVPGELALLFAATGLGKSYLVESLCHAIANGREWFGLPTTQAPTSVLYVHLELTMPRVKERRERSGPAASALLHTLTADSLGRSIDLLDEADREAIAALAREKQARLIVIDPLHEAHSAGETNEAMHKVVRSASALMLRSQAALMLVHHEPKAATDGSKDARSDTDMARGGTRLTGAVKLAMRLKRLPDKTRYELTFAKTTHREPPPSIFLRHGEGGWFEPTEKPEAEADKRMEALERALLFAGEAGLTMSELEAVPGIGSRRTIEKNLDSLAAGKGFRQRSDLSRMSGKRPAYVHPTLQGSSGLQGGGLQGSFDDE